MGTLPWSDAERETARLPAIKSAAGMMGIAVGQSGPLRGCALIVEDDAEQRGLTAMLLQESGLETVECESAEAALATMLQCGREVCFVFADVRLAGVMDGVDLACELKLRWPHLNVVLTSGNPGARLAHLPAGVEYMSKPWQPLDLLIAAGRARSSGPGRSGNGGLMGGR